MDAGVSTSPVARVDQTAVFGSPRMWIALVGLLVLIAGFLTWGLLARAPITVPANGVITTSGGITDIGSSLTGTVVDVYVGVGDRVDSGNNVVTIEDDLGRSVQVKATVPGTVLEIATRVGAFVTEGQSLMILQTSDQPLLAIALVPVTASGSIRPGQEVLVAPVSTPSSEYGFLVGIVEAVGSVPISPARLEQLTIGTAGLAATIDQGVPVLEVRIGLRPADSVSGFEWTLGSGPSYPLLAGTPFAGQILIGDQTPLARLFA
jgi:multidrug resistance efflux pump